MKKTIIALATGIIVTFGGTAMVSADDTGDKIANVMAVLETAPQYKTADEINDGVQNVTVVLETAPQYKTADEINDVVNTMPPTTTPPSTLDNKISHVNAVLATAPKYKTATGVKNVMVALETAPQYCSFVPTARRPC